MRVGKLVIALAVVASFFGVSAAPAEETIRLGVVTRPGAAQNVAAEYFKRLLESKSSLRVTIRDSGSLGTETDILKLIQRGGIEMGIVTSGPFDEFVPEIKVIDYPYLFDTYQQADAALEGPLGAEMLGRLEKAGFKGLAFSENGFRHLTNSRRPVHTVEDVKGLRIRVMESSLHEALWQVFGARVLPIGSLEAVEKGLEAGAIDGQENPFSAIWSNRFYKGQKYLSLTGHVYSSHIAVANLRWFRNLPAWDRALIEVSMKEAARYERRWSRASEADFLHKLKEAGLAVDESPDKASFRAKAATLADLDIFKTEDVKALLRRFQDARQGGQK